MVRPRRIDTGGEADLKEWVETTAAAFAALADGKPHEAAEGWLHAARQIETLACAPLSAAAQNNAGAALLLRSAWSMAAGCFERAGELWKECRDHTDGADLPITGSSVFHLRLAMKHHDSFTALRRQRYLNLCAGAQAIVRFNAHLEDASIAEAACTHPSTIATLSSAFGPECVEIRILRDCTAEAPGAALAPQVAAAYRDKAMKLTESPLHATTDVEHYWTDIERAARMTVLLHPGLLPPRSR